MTVAAVSTILNEGDVIFTTLEHLLAEGVDRIYLADGMSKDWTRDRVREVQQRHPGRVVMYDDREPYHYQPKWINRLAATAAADGHEWIIPFDADEFWYSEHGTIAETLAALPPEITKLYVRMWQHHDFDHKEPVPKPLPKVAYRWSHDSWVHEGNHEVRRAGAAAEGVLSLRELQFRSFEHFCRKAAERNRTLDPSLGPGYGAHMRRLRDLTEAEMRTEWDAYLDREVLHDPVPLRVHRDCRMEPLRAHLRVS